MPVQTTQQKVNEIIAEQLGVDDKEVTPQADIYDDLNADSLDHVELVMAIEEAFDIEISDDDAEKLRTPEAFVQYVTKQQK